jgi:peptidoglycan hydrolase-like protein with peptidoglycan-binding domain
MMSAAPVVYGAGHPASAQTSTQTSRKKKKSKSAISRRSSKPAGQKAPTPDRIKDIQTALQREGTYEGEPNGKWDNSTIDAMKKYQDKNGLSPTGKIDAPTLNKLGLGSDTAGKGAPVPTASSTPPANPPGK